jgi:hypothetical protein
VSQIRSLPGGVLYYGSHTMRAVKSYVYRFRYQVKTFFSRHYIQMAAWVKIEHCQSKLFATAELVHKRVTALLQFSLVGTAQIYQEAVVWQNVVWCVSAFFTIAFKCVYLFCFEWRAAPARSVACEQCESFRTDFARAKRGVFHTSAGTYVCSDIFHEIKYLRLLSYDSA